MLLFIIFQFLNVLLGSLRSLATAKAGRHAAALLNVIAFTFYSAIVKMTSQQELWFVVLTTAITNAVGYYLADYIFCKMQKDRLWKITLEPLYEPEARQVATLLKIGGITYSIFTVKEEKGYIFEIYSYSQKDSQVVKEILNTLSKMPKYFITENTKSLN